MGKDRDTERRSWDWGELFFIKHSRFYKQGLKKVRRRKRRQKDKELIRKSEQIQGGNT